MKKIKKLVATINVTITATDCIINEVGLYGRMVASNFRGPQFDAHILTFENDEIEKVLMLQIQGSTSLGCFRRHR